jgi:hypothetical protein
MRRLMVFLVFLGGCSAWDALRDKISGITETVAAEGVFLGVAEPTSDDIDLTGTAFENDASLSVFLADASDVTDLGGAPISGADVSVKNSTIGDLTLTPEDAGVYRATSENGLVYYPTQDYAITVDYDGVNHKLPGTAPYPANVDLPTSIAAGDSLVVDLRAFDYDSVLVSVLSMTTGSVTYSNEPESIEDIYDFTHGSTTVDTFEIPGSAFGADTLYAVGIAGMRNADTSGFDGVNTLLSAFMLGQMKFYPVSTETE